MVCKSSARQTVAATRRWTTSHRVCNRLEAEIPRLILCLTVSNVQPNVFRKSRVEMEVRQQYWQVAVARRRATEQRYFLQGRIGLEKKLHGYHLAKGANSRGKWE